jgi:signal transduction histidine kinase
MPEKDINIPFVFVIGTLILLALVIFIILFVVLYQRKVLKHEKEKLNIIEENKVELLNNTINIQEEERKNISSDLHDEWGPLLSAIKLNLKQIETINHDKFKQAKISETYKIVDTLVEEMRNISRLLSPFTVTEFGLADAVRELCERINDNDTIKISFKESYYRELVSQKVELTLYRITQELLNNIIKHAEAKNVFIELETNAEKLTLIIKDDGKGFDMNNKNVSLSRGNGLNNIQSRLLIINADVIYESWLNKEGTKVTVEVKLDKMNS